MQGVPNLNMSNETVDEKRMIVRSVRGEVSICESEIVYVKSAGNYVEICVGEKIHVARGTLAKFTESLEHEGFLQIHRSYVLNTRHVVDFNECGAGLAEILVGNGKLLPVSRKRKRHVLSVISSKSKGPNFVGNSHTDTTEPAFTNGLAGS